MSVEPSLFEESRGSEPLASRLRPRSLEEFVGQRHLLDPGKPLRQAIERGDVPSLIFWGPPGSGKTTLGYLIARHTDKHFEPFSAVTEGVPRVREIIKGRGNAGGSKGGGPFSSATRSTGSTGPSRTRSCRRSRRASSP
jgi:replication-associated recombination protein RarA